jgi:hypothetical protein
MKRRLWLLTSYMKCDLCGYTYSSVIGGSPNRPIRYYFCHGRANDRLKAKGEACKSKYVKADALEAFVWAKVEELVTKEDVASQLLNELDQNKNTDALAHDQQVEYIDNQLAEVTVRYERWKKAYEEEVITLAEYKEYREQYRQRHAELTQSKNELEKKRTKYVSLAEQKRMILQGLAQLRKTINANRQRDEIPFEIKRQILGHLIDTIWVDDQKKTVRFEGVLKETYNNEVTTFVFGSNLIW